MADRRSDGERGAAQTPSHAYARPIDERGPDGATPEESLGWQSRAEAALAARDLDGALRAARAAVEHGPDVAHGHALLATALEERGSHPEALAAAEQALQLDGGRSRPVRHLVARLRWRTGDLAAAAASYGAALARDARDDVARSALAALGPEGAKVLERIARAERPARIAALDWPLWLDGHGERADVSPSDRFRHPYFGPAPFNVGDQFVALALARVLRLDEFVTIRAGATDRELDRVNAECDVLLIRGSCFLYPGFFRRHLPPDLLRKIRIPITFVGAGVQFDLCEPMHLLPDDVEALALIHDRCVSTSVRGHRSAELLAGYGIRNVRVTGCPTLVWSLRPGAAVRRPSLDRVGWTVTDLSWAPASELAQLRHVDRLRRAARRLHLVAQGGEVVLQRWLSLRQHHVHGERRDEAIDEHLVRSRYEAASAAAALSDVTYRYRHWPAPLLAALVEDGFFAPTVHETLRFLGELSLVCGTRLHGNVMALAQGVPTVFCVHDARLAEMVELMRAPSFVLGDDVELDPARWDWTAYERQHPAIHDGFVRFFEENGLPHRLLGGEPA